jgi:hypothetical protein
LSHTITQVKSFPPGTVIPKVEGTIKAVFAPKTGEGQYGPWKLQGGILAADGEEIAFTIFDSEDIDYLKGKHAYFISSGKDGRTKKQTGVTLEPSKKDGTPTLVVKGKQGGVVTGDQPNPAYMRGSAENAAAGTQPTPAPAPPARPATAYVNGPGLVSDGPQDKLTRLAVFWLACWHKTGSVEGLSDSVRQSFAASLFIEGNKQGLAAAWPIERAPAPAPAPHAEPAREDDVPW